MQQDISCLEPCSTKFLTAPRPKGCSSESASPVGAGRTGIPSTSVINAWHNFFPLFTLMHSRSCFLVADLAACERDTEKLKPSVHVLTSAPGLQIGQLVKDMEELKSMVRSISAPALIIDQESKAPPGKTGPELLAADMQDGEGHAIPESFHQVHQDQPEAVNDLLIKFLRAKVCHAQV